MMKSVAQIIGQGRVQKNMPAWLNMRYAWKANDELRDRELEFPEDTVQIKNLDYKEKLDKVRYESIIEDLSKQTGHRPADDNQAAYAPSLDSSSREILYSVCEDTTDVNSQMYSSNSLMDLCAPLSFASDRNKKYPVIINVHGGAWFYGCKEIYSHYCMDLARRGAVVVNFNYRLSPQNKYPAAIEDVSYLVKYLCDNAEGLGIDMKSFYMVGDSAGAQLASNYCIIASNSKYRSELDFFTFDRLPERICLNCGVYDMHKNNGSIIDWYTRKDDGSCAISDEQRRLFFNQLDYITEAFPLTYLMYSVNDDLSTHTVTLDRIMKERGVSHVTKAYGQERIDSGHIFHINLNNPEGNICNDEEWEFMMGR